MAAPTAAQRVYYRIQQLLPQTAGANPEATELTGIPIKGLIRRVRFVAQSTAAPPVPIVTNVDFALGESAFVAGTYGTVDGQLEVIMSGISAPVPLDIFADGMRDSKANLARGNAGVPFQLTPSAVGSLTGSLFLAWETSVPNAGTTIQLTIEPLVP